MSAPDPTVSHEEREATRQKLSQIHAANSDIRVEHRFEEGDPVTAILQVAKEVHGEMIVMGSHGRKSLSRLVMNSVAEKVLRQPTCPVLVVKKPTA